MRIGFDGSCLANRRGFGRFARQTLAALAKVEHDHEVLVFVDGPSSPLVEVPARFQRVVVEVGEAPSQAASASGRRRLGDMLAMGRAVARARLDLVYFPASYSFYPVWGVPRVVMTLHDTLALAHPELVFTSWKARMAWKLKEHLAARWADRIVTGSESARRDLSAWFRIPYDRFLLMTEGPDPVFGPVADATKSTEILARYGVPTESRFLLYVGGLSPHKNLPRLIEAFARGASEDVRLVIVGDMGDVFLTHIPVLREAVERLGLQDRVIFTGFVPDGDLVHLYNRAYALVHPSLMEGFGLPPIEAMACGTPVLASTAGSIPEVVGDAGLFFDPHDVEQIRHAIQRLLDDTAERDRLARIALERSARFTWVEGARQLIELFEGLDPSRTGRAANTLGHRVHGSHGETGSPKTSSLGQDRAREAIRRPD